MPTGYEVSFSSGIWRRAALAAIRNRAAGSDLADLRAASLVAFFFPQPSAGGWVQGCRCCVASVTQLLDSGVSFALISHDLANIHKKKS